LGNQLKFRWELSCGIGLKPIHFDHAAAQWGRCLLVLTGEVILPLGFSKPMQYFKWFSGRMEGLSSTTREAFLSLRRLNQV
jgi:hypothetical protein